MRGKIVIDLHVTNRNQSVEPCVGNRFDYIVISVLRDCGQ